MMNRASRRFGTGLAAAGTLMVLWAAATSAAEATRLELKKGDRIIIIGNTLAERMQYYGHFETLLHGRFPELELVVHDLGYSADELALAAPPGPLQRPRPHAQGREARRPDRRLRLQRVVRRPGRAWPSSRRDLEKFINESTTTKYNGKAAPRLVLLSPIAHEDLKNPHITDGKKNNENIKLYADAMAELAAKHGVVFVDLFTPTQQLYQSAEPSPDDQRHPPERRGLPAARPDARRGPLRPASRVDPQADMKALYAAVQEKNLQFFYDYRAVNGCYIYGGRKAPFGIVNFPAEFAKLRKMIQNREATHLGHRPGQEPSRRRSTTATPASSSRSRPTSRDAIHITTPEEELKTFTLPEGYAINLFASEVEFPDLEDPVSMTFDAKGRLWVTTMPSYPMYLPGTKPNDKVLIFEDANDDGKADRCTVFADGLHLPIGIELGDGGVYVSQMPNLMFLKDTDGDDRADIRELIMHGFDTADSHHAMHAFTWDPGGALHWQEGTFHYTQVETPYGPRRCNEAGIFRWEPKTWKFDVFVSYGFANPWGHYIDRWGQNFVADASGGANYYGTAFSGQVVYPQKHGGMKQFFPMQWRPTCGCELVYSRHFPDDTQGDYLLNNNIGFQGILRYRVKEDGSGFAGDADRAAPAVVAIPNFRPVALQFGPDGALYVVDWFNPLVGHMQHSLRDPNRDHTHGRIWRITYPRRPLVEQPKIAGATVPELLDLLKSYEDRTRYRARRELRERPEQEVLSALDKVGRRPREERPRILAAYARGPLAAPEPRRRRPPAPQAVADLSRAPRPRRRHPRASATGATACHDPLELLRKQVNDEHPRVRLEAIRALSFFDGDQVAKAQEIALESLVHPQDDYLEYTLNETTKTLDQRAKGQSRK